MPKLKYIKANSTQQSGKINLQQHRHKLGTEKIAKKIIKNAPLPKFITDDFEYFLAFRYNGYCPMVGYRQRDVFFVLWFDHDFTLYSH
jgi:hypothetical protein